MYKHHCNLHSRYLNVHICLQHCILAGTNSGVELAHSCTGPPSDLQVTRTPKPIQATESFNSTQQHIVYSHPAFKLLFPSLKNRPDFHSDQVDCPSR